MESNVCVGSKVSLCVDLQAASILRFFGKLLQASSVSDDGLVCDGIVLALQQFDIIVGSLCFVFVSYL